MEPTLKKQLLDCIGKVYEDAKYCKLEDDYFIKIEQDLAFLSNYFHTNKTQSFFIAIIFALNYNGNSVDIHDLNRYFDSNPMKLLQYSEILDELVGLNILNKIKSSHRLNLTKTNDQYTINLLISKAILENKPIPPLLDDTPKDIYHVLESIYMLCDDLDDEPYALKELLANFKLIIAENSHFPLVKTIEQFNLDLDHKYLYYYIIWTTIIQDKILDLDRILKDFYKSPNRRIRNSHLFINGTHPLVTYELVEMSETSFLNDVEIKLSEKSKTILQDNDIKIYTNEKNKNYALSHLDIVKKKLIFDYSEMKQLKTLQKLVSEYEFNLIQNRLKEKKLPSGINILLHGAPGTGKTEIVKQLAKSSKRDLVQVDISKSKSMWFGESEKIVKRIFSDYKLHLKDSKHAPILFFNEADAIFAKRKDNNLTNTSQTENAIQNIILEELENFEGILIATTNLVNNLDKAFERRFLFKIKFQNPSKEIRAKIWNAKMKSLTLNECKHLAEQFEFSGGQIENIIRKKEIDEIIYGHKTTLESLIQLCNEETLITQKQSIGFKS